MKVLAFESSCDETSVAVVEDGRKILSNIISSQIKTHKIYGGVVPEIASRQHVENINTVLEEALKESGLKLSDIDVVAATRGPGLVGALLVGLSSAKALSYAIDKPFVPINHIYGHVCANYISHKNLEPPFIGLIVSGGHSYLIKVEDFVDFKLIGRTRDDAAGEAFDKIARAMGIGYPGGPIIDELAKKGNANIDFPKVMLEADSYDFSFSGLKTAVINYLHTLEQRKEEYVIEDVCASFQKAVVDVLVEKSIKLAKEEGMDKIVLAGGVSANDGLRRSLEEAAKENNIDIYYPDKILCTDNAAMIASCGYYMYKSGKYKNEDTIAKPNLGL